MNWKTIRLELAATADFPNGSVGRGFLIRAPMCEDGSIDEQSLCKSPDRAIVRRVWPNEPDERGRLLRVDGHWAMRFPDKPDRLIDLGAKIQTGEKVFVSSQSRKSPFMVRVFD